ncbi:efflux RND transporter periplasmic adaptor subunit [Streptacidiphilus cavernicola]|uniref:Efflux RND transporter periplasmic adaptor subunit n=1 Tax=Streptacidiphilus cavernicola TaxID=3342716 RepID=A0ABV6VUZ1_9ACTN
MKVLPQRRRAALLNSLLAVCLLAGAGAAYASVGSGSSARTTSTTSTATVQKGTVLATVSGSGSLVSPSDAGDSFVTGGTVTKVYVAAGDKVSKGEILAEVDPTSANATLAEARDALVTAKAQLTDAEAGTTGSTVSASAVASAEAQVSQAESTVTSAQAAVDGTVLRASVAGTVASVGNKVGDTVSGSSGSRSAASSTSSSSTPSGFVVITNPAGMQVTADFSETDALKLKKGMGATVTLSATEATLNAKVLSVSSLPVSSSSSGGSSSTAVQYQATLVITSSTAGLRTGLSATVAVATGSATNALYLPTAAVTGTGSTRTVTLVNADGSTQTKSVTVGVEGSSGIQIVSGLTLGQTVRITTVSQSGSGGFPGAAGAVAASAVAVRAAARRASPVARTEPADGGTTATEITTVRSVRAADLKPGQTATVEGTTNSSGNATTTVTEGG